jgi:hypothetical protein
MSDNALTINDLVYKIGELTIQIEVLRRENEQLKIQIAQETKNEKDQQSSTK